MAAALIASLSLAVLHQVIPHQSLHSALGSVLASAGIGAHHHGDAIAATGGRILAACDAFDALTSQRSYKDPFTHDAAMDIMRRDVGRAFDPTLFAHFEDVLREGEWQSAEPLSAAV